MTSTFGGGGPGVQTGCVHCDTDKLPQADGHAADNSQFHYVARWVAGNNGGVTKIDLSDRMQWQIPIPASKVTKLVTGSQFCSTTQLVWEAATNDLLLTAQDSGCAAPNNVGVVKRLDLDVNPPTVTNEFAPGSVPNPIGIGIIPANRCAFGNAGELLIARASGSTSVMKFGVNLDPPCPAGMKTVFTPSGTGIALPRGMALGDFNGTGTFGAYVAGTSVDDIIRFTATDPNSYNQQPFVTTDIVNPYNVAFDPQSGSLFVAEDLGSGRIWRVKPDGAKVQFATTMSTPNGMSFHKHGVMLVSERNASRVIVLDGWRYKFNRGDISNTLGTVDIADADCINDFTTRNFPCAQCVDAGDVNDNGILNEVDEEYILDYLFSGGPPPAAPFFGTSPGDSFCTNGTPISQTIDPTIDLSGCTTYLPNCAISW
jgi:hypothetical protein